MPSAAQRSVDRRFFRLAIPNILSNLTVPLTGLVDTAMLGHLPDIRFLGGVALGAVIFDYAYWTFGFLRMGTTGVTAQAVGRADHDEVEMTLVRGLLLALSIAGLVLLARRAIVAVGFAVLVGEPAIEQAGRAYFDARIWGAPATLANYVLIGWLLGRERARAVLLITVIGNLANVALDYLFIVQMGRAAAGAGAATAISQYLMLATAMILLLLERRSGTIRWSAVLDRGRLVGLIRLNRDLLVRTVCLMSAFALFTNFSAVLGATVLAANTILFRLQMVASYLIDGAAFATESLAGIFHGRDDQPAVRRLLWLAMATGVAFSLPVLVLMFVTPGVLYGLLTSHADVAALAWRYSPWQAAVLVLGSVAFIYDGLFIGLTRGKELRDQMLISLLVFFLPLAVVAVRLQSNHLLWASMASFMLGRAWTLWRTDRRLTAATIR